MEKFSIRSVPALDQKLSIALSALREIKRSSDKCRTSQAIGRIFVIARDALSAIEEKSS